MINSYGCRVEGCFIVCGIKGGNKQGGGENGVGIGLLEGGGVGGEEMLQLLPLVTEAISSSTELWLYCLSRLFSS
jgi:hypothetical protein